MYSQSVDFREKIIIYIITATQINFNYFAKNFKMTEKDAYNIL
jgi:hypothetical protein